MCSAFKCYHFRICSSFFFFFFFFSHSIDFSHRPSKRDPIRTTNTDPSTLNCFNCLLHSLLLQSRLQLHLFIFTQTLNRSIFFKMSFLQSEILLAIFKNLDSKEMLNIRAVSQFWFQVIDENPSHRREQETVEELEAANQRLG